MDGKEECAIIEGEMEFFIGIPKINATFDRCYCSLYKTFFVAFSNQSKSHELFRVSPEASWINVLFINEKKFFVLNNDDREENIFLLQIGDVKNLYKNWLNCFQQTNWRISVHYQEQYQDFFRKKRKFERWQELDQSFHLINDLQNAINCLLSSREMLKKEEATLYKTSSQWDIHIESTKNKEEEAITSKSIDIHKGDQEKNYQQKLTSPLDEDVSSNWYGKVRL